MNDAIRRELAAALEAPELREVRARRAAKIVRGARGYRWVGISDVDGDRIELLGHTGPYAPVPVSCSSSQGLIGEAVRARRTVIGAAASDARHRTAFAAAGSEMVVPILGADSGIAIGTLDVQSDRGDAFGDAEREFVESCASALMPLYE